MLFIGALPLVLRNFGIVKRGKKEKRGRKRREREKRRKKKMSPPSQCIPNKHNTSLVSCPFIRYKYFTTGPKSAKFDCSFFEIKFIQNIFTPFTCHVF